MPRLAKLVLASLLVAFLALPRPAAAASITFQGVGKAGIVSVHSPGLGDITVWAGELLWSGDLGSFYAYCVDINNWAQLTQQVTPTSSSAMVTTAVDGGKKAAWLIDQYAQSIHVSGSNYAAAGLQLAIWAALYNDLPSPSLLGGNFHVNSAEVPVLDAASFYLAALFSAPGGGYFTSEARWLDAPAGFGQDQMIPNPEPGTMILLGSGLAAAAAARRRRKARATANQI